MDERLEQIDKDLRLISLYKKRMDFYIQTIRSLPIIVDLLDGTIYSTLENWIKDGPKAVKEYYPHAKDLELIGVTPTYLESRGLWIFYCDHQENQLDSSKYSLEKSWTTIPLEIRKEMKEDRVDTSKPYYDALPMSGWNTEERAMEELNRAALLWAGKTAYSIWDKGEGS